MLQFLMPFNAFSPSARDNSPTDSSSLMAAVVNMENLKLKISRHRRSRYQQERRRHFSTTLYTIEEDMTYELGTNMPIRHKSHRRTDATDWDTVLSRTFQDNLLNDNAPPQQQRHRRSFALSSNEIMEILANCGDLLMPGGTVDQTS